MKVPSHFPALRRGVCNALVALLALCGLAGCVMGKYPPEDFFTGPYLELARAIDRGDLARVRERSKGIDIDAAGKKQMTLLWYAIQAKNYPAVSALVALGSKPDDQVVEGIGSALTAAFLSKDTALLKALLDGGLSPDHRHPKYSLMLQRAITDGSFAHVELLVERGANVNLRDSIGGTALDEATETLQPDIAIYLVEHGAGVHFCTSNGASTAWGVHLILKRQKPGTELHQKFERLRELMIQKGAKFPPDPPEVVRDQMRAQGLTPAVPPGHAK